MLDRFVGCVFKEFLQGCTFDPNSFQSVMLWMCRDSKPSVGFGGHHFLVAEIILGLLFHPSGISNRDRSTSRQSMNEQMTNHTIKQTKKKKKTPPVAQHEELNEINSCLVAYGVQTPIRRPLPQCDWIQQVLYYSLYILRNDWELVLHSCHTS